MPDVHAPEVVPFSDVADKWVLRCSCGCGLLTEYASREDAEDARDAAEVKT